MSKIFHLDLSFKYMNIVAQASTIFRFWCPAMDSPEQDPLALKVEEGASSNDNHDLSTSSVVGASADLQWQNTSEQVEACTSSDDARKSITSSADEATDDPHHTHGTIASSFAQR